MLNRFERPVDRQSFTLCNLRMPPREDVHARLLTKTERLVIVAFARSLGPDKLGCPGDCYVLAVEGSGIREKLGYGRLGG
jgi:hypothetical protein